MIIKCEKKLYCEFYPPFSFPQRRQHLALFRKTNLKGEELKKADCADDLHGRSWTVYLFKHKKLNSINGLLE